jgi:predicted XRE-type DNA-binding protein
MNETFNSVWDALEDDPIEAENLRQRSALLLLIQEQVKHLGLTQTQSAERLGVTQPRVSDLMRGKIDVFSLDALVKLAGKLGFQVTMTITQQSKSHSGNVQSAA